MTDYISLYKDNPQLSGVYYDRGNIVASDASILVAAKGEYPAEWEGKIIAKNGEEVDEKFPRWEAVIPDQSTMTELAPDWDAVEAGFASANFAKRVKRAKADFEPSVNFGPFKLSCKNAGRLLGLHKKTGISSIFYTDERHAVLIEGAGFRAVVMPVR